MEEKNATHRKYIFHFRVAKTMAALQTINKKLASISILTMGGSDNGGISKPKKKLILVNFVYHLRVTRVVLLLKIILPLMIRSLVMKSNIIL